MATHTSDEENNDDDHSAEGAVFQGLFGHDDDTTSDEEEEGEEVTSGDVLCTSKTITERENVIIKREIMHVQIEEQQIGGSIAHRLWPPAEHLATFVIDAAAGKYVDESIEKSCTSADQEVESPCTTTDELQHLCGTSKERQSRTRFYKHEQKILQKQQIIHTHLHKLLSDGTFRRPVVILELGAGLGLTGLELATQLNDSRVLLTELEDGLPMLRRNMELNRHKFCNGVNAVQVQQLTWGVPEEYDAALDWYRRHSTRQQYGPITCTADCMNDAAIRSELEECYTNNNHRVGDNANQSPLLIIGSDCVYWSELQKPLESALCGLLSRAPPGSMCLLGGLRRWKRDTAFYQSLGKYTRTKTHELRCTLLQETVQRANGDRTVLRIYAIQWVEILISITSQERLPNVLKN